MADRNYLIVGALVAGIAIYVLTRSPAKPDPNSKEEKMKELNEKSKSLLASADELNAKAKAHGKTHSA